jgi:predicted dehydrogenase
VDEIKHFLKCVKERKQTINNIDQGINTMKIALAMKQSQKDKKMIELK